MFAAAAPSTKDREVVRSLHSWYQKGKRDFPWRAKAIQPWQLLVAEVLLQQTQAPRVAEFIPRLFRRYPTMESFGSARESSLARHLAPLGLQHERSKRLRKLAEALLDRGGNIPSGKEELLNLPGVGPYIASAYLSAVLDKPEPSVDVNTARLIERLYGPRTLVDIRHDPHINNTARRLIELSPSPRDFNWAVMDFCASRCTSRSPKCGGCPLLSHCRFGRASLPGATSERSPTAKIRA